MANGRDVPVFIDELHDQLLNRENKLALLTTNTIDVPASGNDAPFHNQSQRPYSRSNQFDRRGHRPPKPYLGKCPICGIQGHTIRRCSQFGAYQSLQPSPNYNSASPSWLHTQPPTILPHWETPWPPSQWQAHANYTMSLENAPWLLDSGASHHNASNVVNVSLQSQYNSEDNVLIGGGLGLKITHTGEGSQVEGNDSARKS
ncbi:Retrovirus-related Pol polyprotein from transposon RE2 [Cardamine amara subsp. amara]|uniref:Retrovirus-related Pol polyprotein from transposon RE2 n=1 Tax=Cardamine amara subsp. amara TaxID=228776 RepID=A0ABD0ZCX7_CARAN